MNNKRFKLKGHPTRKFESLEQMINRLKRNK